jgi:hypothetical protein
MSLERSTSAKKRQHESSIEETRKEANRKHAEYSQYARRRRAENYVGFERDVVTEQATADVIQQSIKLESTLDNIEHETHAPNKQVNNY